MCPLGFIYGEKSALVTELILNYMKSKFREDTPIIEIEGAYHHVLLDKPIELAETIKEIGKDW
jgi:pimeloyl-ACP methyl ester carboxylesterase